MAKGTLIAPGQKLNPAGTNQFSNRPKELVALARATCLEAAQECIQVLMDIMKNARDEKTRVLCARELLDRGIGKAQQSISIDSSTGQPLSAQQTLDIVDKALKQQEEHEAMAKRILELEEQIKWLNNKPVADVAIVAVAETPKE